jgi:hypothetical protein
MKNKNFDTLRTAAAITYGEEIGHWLFDTWKELNHRHFAEKLTVGAITFGLIPHGHAWGLYHPVFNKITLHHSLIEPKSENPWDKDRRIFNFKFAKDVLLHEMIHQHLYQHHGSEYKKQDSHNGELWCNEVNRLSAELGLNCKPAAPVKPRRIDGKVTRKELDGHLTRKQIATWPHSVKPNSAYL